MSANYSGEDSKLQIGLEATYGTAVAPTTELDMLNESFGEETIIKTEETLVGKAVAGRSDVMGRKVPGGFGLLVKPDNIGLLLACALGSEASASNEGSGVYSHEFSLLTGSASTLPHFTAVVDKKTSVRGFISNKVKSLSFDLPQNDYLSATVECVGRQEQADALESLTLSTLRAFNFNDLTIEIDDVAVNEITSFKIVINNNLEDDLFVADGSEYMVEPDRQRREVIIDVDALWTDDIATLRTDNYLTASPVKFEAILTGDIAGGALPYKLSFTVANAYFTQAKPEIGGPERMTLSLSLRAGAIGSVEPLVVELQNTNSSEYLT